MITIAFRFISWENSIYQVVHLFGVPVRYGVRMVAIGQLRLNSAVLEGSF